MSYLRKLFEQDEIHKNLDSDEKICRDFTVWELGESGTCMTHLNRTWTKQIWTWRGVRLSGRCADVMCSLVETLSDSSVVGSTCMLAQVRSSELIWQLVIVLRSITNLTFTNSHLCPLTWQDCFLLIQCIDWQGVNTKINRLTDLTKF